MAPRYGETTGEWWTATGQPKAKRAYEQQQGARSIEDMRHRFEVGLRSSATGIEHCIDADTE